MEEAQIQDILIQNGVLTVNEVRQDEGIAAALSSDGIQHYSRQIKVFRICASGERNATRLRRKP